MILGTLVFMIPAILFPTLITARFFSEEAQDQKEKQMIESFAVAEDRIENLLYDAYMLSHRIQQDTVVEDYLLTTYSNEHLKRKNQMDIVKIFDEMFNSYDYFNGIIFLKNDGSIIGSTKNWRFIKDSDSKLEDILYSSLHSDISYSVNWAGAIMMDDLIAEKTYRVQTENDILVYGMRRSVYKYASSKDSKTVDVFYSISKESLDECFEFLSDDTTKVTLLDQNGKRIAGCEFREFNSVPDFYTEINKNSEYGSFIYEQENEESQQIIYHNIGQTGWTLVSSTPMHAYTSSTFTMIRTAIIVGIIVIAIMVVLYSIWATRFCKPLADMTKTLKLVEGGDLDIRLEENARSDEVKTIQIQFNQMLESINALMYQKEQNEREKLLLEMRSLQAQITPHFIYNTITSIRWTATMCGAHRVADMLISLVSLLRPVFSEWTLDWTLNEELKYVENYINLMRLRHGNMINIEINKTPDSTSLLIPRFILQPLLENCCEHTSVFDRRLNITLNIDINDKTLFINVIDDGDGIPAEKLENILNKLKAVNNANSAPQSPAGSIGLVNVNRRIKLYYGDKYGLSVSSVEGKGTCVEVKLGLKRR